MLAIKVRPTFPDALHKLLVNLQVSFGCLGKAVHYDLLEKTPTESSKNLSYLLLLNHLLNADIQDLRVDIILIQQHIYLFE